MSIYAPAVFVSAFLLFLVQPLIGKYILPWFGGGPAVWTTCMLFFQVVLLGGYTYAHVVRTRLAQRRQIVVHLVILAAALALLPITPDVRWKPEAGADPTWRILALLSVSVGLPYLVLSATAPLLQAWFSLSQPGRSPYRLYALSNAGSLLALLSYPFVVEPGLALTTQANFWSGGFVVFALLCGWCALRTWKLEAAGESNEREIEPAAGGRPPSLGVRLLWLAYAACASVLLLAVTNQMCWDVAVVPFLWVLPLSLYLLTFIICFHSESWYFRPVFWPLLAIGTAVMIWLMFRGISVSIATQVCGYCGGLFACCMVCHGELVRLKPAPRHLTSFYLMVAAGGALGGIFVTIVAPQVFPAYLELHIALWICAALAMVGLWYAKKPHRHWKRAWWARLCPLAFAAILAVLGIALVIEAKRLLTGTVSMTRNFHGVLRVVKSRWGGGANPAPDQDRWHYVLQHGRIVHGYQFLSRAWRHRPTSYYASNSGIGVALRNFPRGSGGLRVGVLGLGIGAVVAHGQAGDYYRFYEINPEVKRLATSLFTYLENTQATCDIVLGDGRLSLEREEPQHFDILLLDAFNSDAVPVHLLTREAFQTYLRHLRPDGVIVVNISNRFVDLRPVLHALAGHFDLSTGQFIDFADRRERSCASQYILMTRNERFLQMDPVLAAMWPECMLPPSPCLWTDDYSNLLHVLRMH